VLPSIAPPVIARQSAPMTVNAQRFSGTGLRFGPYIVDFDEPLGGGATGDVFAAAHETSGHRVAIKLYKESSNFSAGARARDQQVP